MFAGQEYDEEDIALTALEVVDIVETTFWLLLGARVIADEVEDEAGIVPGETKAAYTVVLLADMVPPGAVWR